MSLFPLRCRCLGQTKDMALAAWQKDHERERNTRERGDSDENEGPGRVRNADKLSTKGSEVHQLTQCPGCDTEFYAVTGS